uniref:Uncharacterized protein n=1 Tax=Anguilla anguilla TaxID=7936 RepID=A0A0E9QLS9_ANGAN
MNIINSSSSIYFTNEQE